MKIDNYIPNSMPLDILQKKTAPKPDSNALNKTNASGSAFSVKISAALEQLKSSSSAVTESDDVRREKVAAIRSQLASGTYNISGKDVASKILDAIK